MLEILGKTDIDFMGKRKITFALSGLMVALGLVAVIQIARGAANLGIDFAGGTAVQLKFEQPIRIDEARKALESNGVGNAELQEFGEDNKLLVRVKTSTTIEEKIAERIVGVFAKEFPNNPFAVDSTTEIGPTIGKKLQEDALIAILISFAGIIMYIAARFELRFGVAAALAVEAQQFPPAAQLDLGVQPAPELEKVVHRRNHRERHHGPHPPHRHAAQLWPVDGQHQQRHARHLRHHLGLAEVAGLDGVSLRGGDAPQAGHGEFPRDDQNHHPGGHGFHLHQGDERGGDPHVDVVHHVHLRAQQGDGRDHASTTTRSRPSRLAW